MEGCSEIFDSKFETLFFENPKNFFGTEFSCRSRHRNAKSSNFRHNLPDSIALSSIENLALTSAIMRRRVVRLLSLQNTLIQRPAIPPPIHNLSLTRINCLHTTSPNFKRDSASKSRHREEKLAAKQKLEETLSSAEQWLDAHDPDRPDVILNKKAMLLEQTDPFEWDAYVQNLKDIVMLLRKEGSLIRQGKSDPEMLRGLQVELPDDLGGKQRFLDVATVGPKPGDARSLLISVFDVEVRSCSVRG